MPEASPTPAPAATPPAPPEPSKARSAAERLAAALTKVSTAPEAKPAPETAAPTEKPAATEEPKPEDKASRRYADIVRREGLLVAKQRELSRTKAEQDARAKELDAKEEILRSINGDPTKALKALKLLGVSYEDLTQVYLADGKPTPELEARAVRNELAEFKASQERAAQETAARERQRIQAEQAEARADFQRETSEFLDGNAEQFPLTHARKGSGLIATVIEENWRATKKWMSKDEAAKRVEEYFRKEREKEDEVLTKSKAKEAPKVEAPKPPERTAPAPTQERRALTMDLSGETPESFRQRKTTDIERRKRALALLSAN